MVKPVIFFSHNFDPATSLPFAEQASPVSLHLDVVNLADTTPYRVFVGMEPPQVLDITQKVIDNHKFFDLILSWNEDIVRACPNAVLFVATCPPFVGPCVQTEKDFSVAYLTSSKNWCTGHRLRLLVYDTLPSSIGNLKVIKHRSPPAISSEERNSRLAANQYHIAIENCHLYNYFTEKLMDCFLSRTIPLYWGCPNIGNYFDASGILQFEGVDGLMNILRSLTPEFYQSKAEVIESNYQKALAYTNLFSRVDYVIALRLEEKR
jgi:hypothetical protein